MGVINIEDLRRDRNEKKAEELTDEEMAEMTRLITEHIYDLYGIDQDEITHHIEKDT